MDGKIVDAPLEVPVKVLAIDNAADGACEGSFDLDLAGPALRYRLASEAGQEWDLIAQIPGLPSEQFAVGEQVDLWVAASYDITLFPSLQQTVVLARNERPLLFLARTETFSGSLPSLFRFGIELELGAQQCVQYKTLCSRVRVHDLNVRFAGHDVSVRCGSTAQVGELSFTVGDNRKPVSDGTCDSKAIVHVGGFTHRAVE